MDVRHALTMLGMCAAVTLPGCREATSADHTLDAKLQPLDIAVCAPSQGGFSATVTNPYFPIRAGSQWVYEGTESGALIHLEITALNQRETVAEVSTRVVEERESSDGVVTEISRNFFAQARDGTVCYFGEAVDIYEGGQIVSHEGSWRADQAGNAPGIMMPSTPQKGQTFKVESAPGVAEDEATIVGTGTAQVPAGTFTQTIKTREYNPLDGGRGTKVYASGTGLIVDGSVDLISYTP